MTEQLKQARMPDEIWLWRTSYGDIAVSCVQRPDDKNEFTGTHTRYIRAIEQPPSTGEMLEGMKKPDVAKHNEGTTIEFPNEGWNAALDAVIAKIEGK